ncbi:phosphatidylserine decarboxylase [Erythrobacter sp. HI0063]|jgi:phosphatidylserine decarboxylase|uniref:phosphatidylserine decarboxylase n=1 Tax=unclassified Erythrobacter TaxID=2633097 RepID=UPI0007C27C67|nr:MULTISPECIES: phosphatidylserine decarboxylase [unclassified Erythrobacter]KZY56405.1 phosphatidylserine decarboxylase [Erythrobacter sp. HI0063]MBO9510976.1 phosphatidylserine decarboxylase [Erythrobacter sp. A6_0]|tara:strand:+ start:214 stop:966 length:753 start_codon:yes stop_codon:yes gene_type:complete
MPGELLDNHGRGDASWSLPSIHPEGRKFGLIAVGISLIFLLLLDWDWIGWPLLALAGGVFAFFRDPERVVPQNDVAIVSPADGLVTLISQVEPPEELRIDDGSGIEGLPTGPVTRVSIFMSVFDVHINRAPIGGVVRRLVYLPGKFLNADLDKASEENERQHIMIERADGVRIGFTQIAGLVARRIVPFVKVGDTMGVGQRVGLIRFGSRVDVYLPAGTDSKVLLGQRVIAGETVLGEVGTRKLIEGIAQ